MATKVEILENLINSSSDEREALQLWNLPWMINS